MYVDKELLLSNAQAITATAYSTNTANLGKGDAGKSDDLFLYVKTGAAFNTLTSLDISLGTDDNESFTSETILFKSNFPLAALAANKDLLKIKLPVNTEQYVRLTYTVNGSNPSTGTLTAMLAQQPQTNV